MSIKKLLCLGMAAAVLCGSLPTTAVQAQGERTWGEDITTAAEGNQEEMGDFQIEDGVLVEYDGAGGDVVIPEGVTSIGDSAFEGCSSLTGVSIPEGVTSIAGSAFSGCSSLAGVTIPNSVTSIGGSAFWGTEWLNNKRSENPLVIVNHIVIDGHACSGDIVIPEGVTSIAGSAFSGCSSLTGISIPEGVTSIGRSAFYGCSSLTGVSIPEGVTSIGFMAFWGCSSLASVSIGEGVTSIGERAFYGCSSLTSIMLPESVTEIGGSAFSRTEWLSNKRLENPLVIVNHIVIDGNTCSDDIVIPEGVTSIAGDAFSGYKGWSITIPNSVTSIGKRAFPSAYSLTIYGTKGSYAERYARIYKIKFSAVQSPKPGESKTLSANNVTLSKPAYAYDGKAKKPAVTVTHEGKTLKEGTDYTVSYKDNTNAGTAAVTVSGKGTYRGTVTKRFTIAVKKGSVHKAGAYKYQVTGTSAVTVAGLSSSGTTKVDIPKTAAIGGKTFKVTAIGKNAFKNNKKITSVVIGNNVKTIGASAFSGCTKLGKATVGSGVTEIGSGAFQNCKKLGAITIKSAKLKKVGKNALKGIKPTAKIKVPAKKLSAYKKLLKNKGQGKRVKISR